MEYWEKIDAQFDLWTAPHRPSQSDIRAFQKAIPPGGKTLLLGLTKELLPLATCALDSNKNPANNLGIQTIRGCWDNIPFLEEFDAVIGDGCLTIFQNDPNILFEQAFKALKPGGIFSLRVFIAPEEREDLSTIIVEKNILGFHAFKWRVAHCLSNPYVKVKDIYNVLKPICSHPTLEIYKDAEVNYYFPKLSALPKWDIIHFNDDYDLADRCPIITWIKPK